MLRLRHPILAAGVLVTAATAAIASVAIATPAPAQTPASPTSANPGSQRSIVVVGSGRVSDRPDTVTVVVGVETTAPRARDALNANSAAAARVIDLFKDRGIGSADIQTANLSINPRFDDRGRRITGYIVNNTVSVRIRGIDKAGPIVDAAADLAGDSIRIQGISFSIANTAPLAKRAREAAVKDGREQAETVAAAAGEKLGRLRLIRVIDQGFPVPVAFSDASARNATAELPIQAGSLDVTSQVELVFDLA